MRLSVVIPVYNEARTIREVVERVRAVGIDKEILLVDDGSTDGTRDHLADIARLSNVRVLYQPHNQGKGAALRTGIAAATGDIVVIQDADLEYDPQEYLRLVQPILDGRADVVYGSRFAAGPRPGAPFWHTFGNRLLTWFSNRFTGLGLTDMETCYKVFRREIIQRAPLRENRFGFEPEVTARIAGLGCRVVEIPISYAGRSYAEGKKIGWKDGVRAIWCILKYRRG